MYVSCSSNGTLVVGSKYAAVTLTTTKKTYASNSVYARQRVGLAAQARRSTCEPTEFY